MNSTDNLSPTETAELVRDARQLVTAVERATRRTTAVFVAAMGVTIAATALAVPVVGDVAAVVTVTAFTAALVMLMYRIALGPMPAAVTTTTPADAPPDAANGSGTPATGSGPATPTNRRILRK